MYARLSAKIFHSESVFFCLTVCILFESVIFAIVLIIIITMITYRAQFPNGSQHITKNSTF